MLLFCMCFIIIIIVIILLSLFKEVWRGYPSLNDSAAELLELLTEIKEELFLLMAKRVVMQANQVAYVGEDGFTLGIILKIFLMCFVPLVLMIYPMCLIYRIMYATRPMRGKFVLV